VSTTEAYLVDSIRLAMENVRERNTWPFGAVGARWPIFPRPEPSSACTGQASLETTRVHDRSLSG